VKRLAKNALAGLAFLGFLACWTTTSGQEDTKSPGAQFGKLGFLTSGSPKAQEVFLVGVKLLHNFEYEEALETFQQARKTQPDFAMAYWGEALCHNHPTWGEQDLEAARNVLKALDARGVIEITPREKGYLDAVRILYGEGEKAKRDSGYEEAMRQLVAQYPKDDEAAAFHALAILGTCAGDRDFRVYMRAARILEDLFKKNPQHPGVLHYLIHCYDDPIHAPLGLRAAKLYGTVAASSAHAKHMPSHIYLPLGMWDEFLQANEESWAASLERIKRRKLQPTDHDIHALHTLQWLQYGYLQKGRQDKALECLETMKRIHAQNPVPMTKWYLAMMLANYCNDATNWEKADVDVDLKGVELSAPASKLFATGLMAIRHSKTGVERVLQQMGKLREATETKVRPAVPGCCSTYFTGAYASSVRAARIMETQLEALQLLADGQKDRAVARLLDAVAAEEKLTVGYGPPLPIKPSLELLGEVLLNLDRPKEAVEMFTKALDRNPRRVAALAGLAEAARRTGNKAAAAKARQEIDQIRGAEAGLYRAWKELPFGGNSK
jgi:tetratricopeptide (TPR) repeat protein